MVKVIKYVVLILSGIGLLIFIVDNFNLDKEGTKKVLERTYHGIILEIKKFKDNRGKLSIRVKDEWIHFGFLDEKVENYILVGDSIVKESGSKKIDVYRKNLNEEWYLKTFK